MTEIFGGTALNKVGLLRTVGNYGPCVSPGGGGGLVSGSVPDPFPTPKKGKGRQRKTIDI